VVQAVLEGSGCSGFDDLAGEIGKVAGTILSAKITARKPASL
jgi:hypothetical protein